MSSQGWSKPETPIATKSPTTADLYWVAGLLEGEGYFTKSPTSQCLGCEMTDRDVLAKVQALLGGTIDATPRQRNNGKPIYRWRAYGTRARGIAMTLFTLLGPRRQGQILEALSI